MKESPLLMSGEMIRAYIAGRKTVTRRLRGLDHVNLEPGNFEFRESHDGNFFFYDRRRGFGYCVRCPYFVDRLWLRETFGYAYLRSEGPTLVYKATDEDRPVAKAVEKWRPSIHMPRDACRFTPDVVSVRVERLQQINIVGIKDEGWPGSTTEIQKRSSEEAHRDAARDWYSDLWDNLNGERHGGKFKWVNNPWVWVLAFTPHKS